MSWALEKRHACSGSIGMPVTRFSMKRTKNGSVRCAFILLLLLVTSGFSYTEPALARKTPQQAVDALNASLLGSGHGPYGTGLQDRNQAYSAGSGFGVMIRNMNDGEPFWSNGKLSQVVATMWHNDIDAPNMCYDLPATSVVLVSAWDLNPKSPVRFMQNVFPQMARAQTDPNWGWGVFYAHDANALDKRGYPAFKEWFRKPGVGVLPNGQGDWGYDVPYGWSDKLLDGPWFTRDPDKVGAADKLIGNPGAYFNKVKPNSNWQGTRYGAGAGIHVINDYQHPWDGNISNAWSSPDDSAPDQPMNVHQYAQDHGLWLGSDQLCAANYLDGMTGWWGEMNYCLKSDGNWTAYLDQVSDFAQAVQASSPQAQWAQDLILPWVNNFRDMINLGTALARHRDQANGFWPKDEEYWGWNEIPIDRKWQKPGKETLFALILPQTNDNPNPNINDYLGAGGLDGVLWQLRWYKDNGYVGKGSWIAVGQQMRTAEGHFYKQFALQDFALKDEASGITYRVKDGVLDYDAFKLKVLLNKKSAGMVWSNPAGIDCGNGSNECAGWFGQGTLTATANPGFQFLEWVNCPDADGSRCQFKLGSNTQIKAKFGKI